MLGKLTGATIDVAPEVAAQVPAGRVNIRIDDGKRKQYFVVRYRRRLRNGTTRLYADKA